MSVHLAVNRFLIFVTCYALFGSAFAADAYWRFNSGAATQYASGDAACQGGFVSTTGAYVYHSATVSGSSGGIASNYTCIRKKVSNNVTEAYGASTRYGATCTAPKVLNAAGTCDDPSCPLPKIMVGGVCSNPPPICKKDEEWVAHTPYCPAPKNWGGCEVTVVKLLSSYKLDNQCSWLVMKTGNQASGDPDVSQNPQPPPPKGPPAVSPPVPPKPDGNCPEGTVQMGQTASGAPICVGTGSNPPNTPPPPTGSGAPSTSTGTDGTATTVTTNTTQNHDGSSTTITTTTVVKPDGSKSTTSTGSTTANAGGQPGKSDVGDKDKTFCQQNPTLTVCSNSSVSGSCEQTSCTGDAIQCATLRAAAAMQCKMKKDADDLAAHPMTQLGADIGSGNDPEKGLIEDTLKGTEVDVSSPNLDTTGFLGGGQCLAPIQFSVRGKPVSFSFATVCEQITPLRGLVMAICSILSYLVLARSLIGNS